MSAINLLSPAKVNLTLEILGLRPDGYHELRSIMQPIDFFDEVRIETSEGEGITLECSGIEVPEDETNLAWRAADSYLRESGMNLGIRINIKKRIPTGAGLGGGSGNAASVLVGLNKLTGALNENKLLAIASGIGSDVPFFIRSQTALVEGMGEKVKALKDIPLFYYLVLCPKLHVSTKEVYKKWDELNGGGASSSSIEEALDLEETTEMFSKGNPQLKNDLEAPAVELYPEIGSYKKILSSMGAEHVMMTGSGSSVFALYKSGDDALDAYEYLKTSPTFKLVLASGIKGWHFVI